jgi:protein-tyrosine-phosphatase
MAEHLLRARGVDATSAGTAVAVPGEPMTGHALSALARRGIDSSGHRARRLTRELVEEADLVLAMTAGHRDAVLALATRPVVVLDVPDPYGGTAADYRACLSALSEALRHEWGERPGP